MTARRIGRISPVRVSASTMCGLGVSVTVAPHWSGDVGDRRVIVSVTSAKVASMGAPGLWTVTRAHSTRSPRADARDALGQGLDQIDRIRLDSGFHAPGHREDWRKATAQSLRYTIARSVVTV